MSESGAQKFLGSIEGTLEIPQSQAAPGWTSKAPSVAGWYWWRRSAVHRDTEIVKVYRKDRRLNIAFMNTNRFFLDGIAGEFAGPLPPPEGDAHG